MEFEDDQISNGGDDLQNVQNMFNDMGLGQDNNLAEFSKKDTTIFIVDCSKAILQSLQGQNQCQLKMILDGYSNFLQNKIIASAGDLAGLILYNVKNQHISSFKHINVIHRLSEPSAQIIKDANNIFKNFQVLTGGLSDEKATIQDVLWTYGDEIKKLSDAKYYLRLFLFTDEENPHEVGTEQRLQALNQARILLDKNVLIQLFPLRKLRSSVFNIAKFYQEIITLDPEQINETVLDSSSRILNLKARLRQKQFKKRTLNRLLMKIGNQTQIGIKIYALYTKAKKPVPKKVDAKSNRHLQRVVKKLDANGKVMFDGQIGTYFPLGGQKVKFSKEDMNKVKNLEPPGMTLIGFKDKKFIKPYHNLRTSYFLYPDEEHVTGSSQFCDALINQLVAKNLVGIAKIVPRNNQQMSFAALLPQKQTYDEQSHFQTPPGFNMVILPFAEDIVHFVGEKTVSKPVEISEELAAVTNLLVNTLTLNDFELHAFENPALQKFYSHLQALALGQKTVQQRPDLLLPDRQGLQNYSDIIQLLMQTVKADTEFFAKQQIDVVKKEDQDVYIVQNKKPSKKTKSKGQKIKQQIIIQDEEQKVQSRGRKKDSIIQQSKQSENVVQSVEDAIIKGEIDSLKVADLKKYLKHYNLEQKGKKDDLINRALVFISERTV